MKEGDFMKMDSSGQERPIQDVIQDIHQRVIKENGRLYTEEEVTEMVEKIRADLKRKEVLDEN